MIDAPLSGDARNHQQDALRYIFAHLPKPGRNQKIVRRFPDARGAGADHDGGRAFRLASGPDDPKGKDE
jgi:hypothetical protein